MEASPGVWESRESTGCKFKPHMQVYSRVSSHHPGSSPCHCLQSQSHHLHSQNDSDACVIILRRQTCSHLPPVSVMSPHDCQYPVSQLTWAFSSAGGAMSCCPALSLIWGLGFALHNTPLHQAFHRYLCSPIPGAEMITSRVHQCRRTGMWSLRATMC